MRQIEEATMPFLSSLLLSERRLLDLAEQQMLAAMLCLVSMRVEASSHEMAAIPKSDHCWLMENPEPPANWKIYIARYIGSQVMDQRYTAMQIALSPKVVAGPAHCNTQVTSLIIGQFFAHLFSSTVWKDFPGYEGADLVQLWPLTSRVVAVQSLPTIFEQEIPWLHESIARTTKHVPN
jgi:hypothetical protein